MNLLILYLLKDILGTRIKRILLYSLLGITQKEMDISKKINPYVRVLGFNEKGKYLLSQITKKNPNLKVITIYTLGYSKDSWGNLDFTKKLVVK